MASKSKRPENRTSSLAAIRDAIERVDAEIDGTRVRYSGRISEVHWKDGIASLWIGEDGTRGLQRPSTSNAVALKAFRGFDVRMPEEDAAAIKKGAKLQIDAILHGVGGQYACRSSEDSGQAFFDLHVRGQGNGAGAFVRDCYSRDYVLKLSGSRLDPVWCSGEGLLAGAKDSE